MAKIIRFPERRQPRAEESRSPDHQFTRFPRQSATEEYQQWANLREANLQLAETELKQIFLRLGIIVPFQHIKENKELLFDALANLRDARQLTEERMLFLEERVSILLSYLRNVSQATQNMEILLGNGLEFTDVTEKIFAHGTTGALVDYAVFTAFPYFLDTVVR